MKKTILFLGAVLAIAACSKTVTVVDEDASVISINAVTNATTRGAEFVGAEFPADKPIIVGASVVSTEAAQQNFLKDAEFNKDATTGYWKTNPTTYWPIGGVKVDFLAYAKLGTPVGDITPAFDASVPANKFTVSNWNTTENQVDLVYSVANGQKNQTTAVNMEFKHTLALVIFNVRLLHGEKIKIKSIVFEDKATTGTLEVNNERNEVALKWTDLNKTNITMPNSTATSTVVNLHTTENPTVTGVVGYDAEITQSSGFSQLGETLLVIPQAASNPVITYTIGEGTTEYVFTPNAKRLDWEAGKAYVYDLSFNFNEIMLNPTVLNWTVVDPS